MGPDGAVRRRPCGCTMWPEPPSHSEGFPAALLPPVVLRVLTAIPLPPLYLCHPITSRPRFDFPECFRLFAHSIPRVPFPLSPSCPPPPSHTHTPSSHPRPPGPEDRLPGPAPLNLNRRTASLRGPAQPPAASGPGRSRRLPPSPARRGPRRAGTRPGSDDSEAPACRTPSESAASRRVGARAGGGGGSPSPHAA